ncbi:phage major capsid protein [Streptococcus sp. 121]|uniref:phage major capsid protein n=1 Tax=Streptococcus sp. 121 TaxID=2797637 RepID=UPI0018F087EB|nr:phage major capsid protein [Streptococcus sp. 121]MBJ6745210.1 phage major capsid protein [Streptococcus sp. 121]
MELNETFKAARKKFLEAVANGADQETQEKLYEAMMDAIEESAVAAAREEVEGLIARNPKEAEMSANELEFWNAVKKDAPTGIEKHFPEETVDKIFEDLVESRPLLEHIGLRNASIRLKFLSSATQGQAVWGKINSEIKGQLEQSFDEEKTVQNKLTAFVVIPKDTEKFSPAWLSTFVITQINEAFADALEDAFLNGDGSDKPVGLTRDVTAENRTKQMVFAEKTKQGDLTFADSDTTVKEIKDIHKFHSTKENGKRVATEGKLVLVVNPADAWDVKSQWTSLNAQGVYVTALPFNPIIIESVKQAAGKVTSFIKGRYDAVIAGGVEIGKFEETFALEDLTLYTAKQFAHGMPHDAKTAAVWELKLAAKPKSK